MEPGGDQVAVGPVEGAADDGKLEVPGFSVEGLGVRHDWADVPGTGLGGLGPDLLHEARFRCTAQVSAKNGCSEKAIAVLSGPLIQASREAGACRLAFTCP
jgi:hypothetical protein